MGRSQRGPVVVFGLGGTIAMTSQQSGGVIPTLSTEDLLGAVPGLTETGIEIETVDFRRLPGASLGFRDLDELSGAVADSFARGAIGAVVTEGTDPIEEVSYHLDLRHSHGEPLIVTGAMRNPTMAGADGAANLLASVITAADPASRGRGVVVVLNDEIHLARRVRKMHSTASSAFASPNGGAAGYLVEKSPRWMFPPLPRHLVPAPKPGSHPRIALHTAVLGDDPAALDGIADRLDGLIVAGMGVGHVPQSMVDPLAKAAASIPVVLASRIGTGPALTRTYGFPGSESDLIGVGLIPAGFLDPLKARILLRALVAAGSPRDLITQTFAVAGGNLPDNAWPWSTTEGDI